MQNFWRWQTENHLLQIIDSAPFFLGLLARFVGIREDNINRLATTYYRFVPKKFLRLLNVSEPNEIKIGLQKDIELAVVFVDIRNFTTISEQTDPQTIMTLLNDYFKGFHEITQKHNGFIDKFLGDGVMILFPDSADDAIKASVAIVDFVDKSSTEKNWHSMRITVGVGVSYGAVNMGTVGTDQRMDTTVIGDVVNTAARLQNLTKKLNTPILFNRELHDALSPEMREYACLLGKARVKGKQKIVDIYKYSAN